MAIEASPGELGIDELTSVESSSDWSLDELVPVGGTDGRLASRAANVATPTAMHAMSPATRPYNRGRCQVSELTTAS